MLGEGGGGLQWQGKNAHLILHRKGKEKLTFEFDEGGDEIWKFDLSYYSQAWIVYYLVTRLYICKNTTNKQVDYTSFYCYYI